MTKQDREAKSIEKLISNGFTREQAEAIVHNSKPKSINGISRVARRQGYYRSYSHYTR